jgi:S1-C subfamily serine protease
MIDSRVVKDLIERVSPSLAEILAPMASGLGKVGTGFAVSSEGTYATCMHVLGNATEFYAQFWGESKPVEAELLGRDADHDLAVLSVHQPVRPLPLGDFAQVDVGDDVLSGGFPLEIWVPSFHKGMVSFKGELRLPHIKGEVDAVQLDGTMNRGNSGGPIIDPRDGRVVAIVSSSMGAIDQDLASLVQRQEGARVAIGGVDPVAALKKVIIQMYRHLQLGIGYGISVDYLSRLIVRL